MATLQTLPVEAAPAEIASGIVPTVAPVITPNQSSQSAAGLLQALLGTFNGSRSLSSSLSLSPGTSGTSDWTTAYRASGTTPSNLLASPQIGLPFEGQLGNSVLGLTYLKKNAAFSPTASPLDFSLLGFNGSSDVVSGVTLSSAWYSSKGALDATRMAGHRGRAGFAGAGTPGAGIANAEMPVGGAATSNGLSLQLSRTKFSTLFTNVDKGFTLGTLDLQGAPQADAIKTLAGERGVARTQFGAGYDLSSSGALNFSFDRLKDAKGSLSEQNVSGHGQSWSFGLTQRRLDAGFASFKGLRETQFQGLQTGQAVSTTGFSLGLQPGKSTSLNLTSLTATGANGGMNRQSFGFSNSHFHVNMVDQSVGSKFTALANVGDAQVAADAMGAGSHFKTLNLEFAPGAKQNLTFNQLNISDSHGGIQSQDLALNVGGFSLSSRSQSVGAGFSNIAHLVDPAQKLMATKELGVAQNAFSAQYAAGKNSGLSFASDTVTSKAGSVHREDAGIKTSILDLNIRQLDISRGFRGLAGLNSSALAGAATTPGLSERNVDLTLRPAKGSSLNFQQIQAKDEGGAFSSSHLAYQRGAGLLLEVGQRETGAGFKSFNAGLGFSALAPEAGTQRSDFHLRAGTLQHNFFDATYMSVTGESPAGSHVDALALAADPALAQAASLWAGVGELTAPTTTAAAVAAPTAAPVATVATLFGAGVRPRRVTHSSTSVLAAGSSIKRAGFSFGASPGRDTRVEGSFVSFTNGLAFQSQGQNIRGINLNLKQKLGKDSSFAVVHNSLDTGSADGASGRSAVNSVSMKLNTVGGIHLTSDYFSQKLPDQQATGHGSFVLADGSLHLDAHFKSALDPSGHVIETHSDDIQYAVSRNFTFHLQNNDGGTHLMSDSLGSGVSATASTTPAPPAGAVQQSPGSSSAPAFMGGQAMALKRMIGGGALGLVFFHGADPDSLGIGGSQFSYATNANPSLPLHLQATINHVATSIGSVPVKRLQFSYSPMKQITVRSSLDENRLMPDGKVLNGDRKQFTLETPTLTLATSSQVDPLTHRRMQGDSLQVHSTLYRHLGLKASLTRNPETPAGAIEHATLRQVEASDGPFTAFYRESKPLVGRVGVTRGVTGTWKMARSWNFNLGLTDNPLDLKGNVVRGESQTWGLNGLLFNGIKFRFDRLGGIVDPVTHLRVHSTQVELSGTVPGWGTLNGAYRSDLTAGDSTNWMWTEFTKMGLDPAPMLLQSHGELRGDVYALNYVLPSSGSLNFNIDGALIHQSNAAFHQPDTTIADFKVGLTATF